MSVLVSPYGPVAAKSARASRAAEETRLPRSFVRLGSIPVPTGIPFLIIDSLETVGEENLRCHIPTGACYWVGRGNLSAFRPQNWQLPNPATILYGELSVH